VFSRIDLPSGSVFSVRPVRIWLKSPFRMALWVPSRRPRVDIPVDIRFEIEEEKSLVVSVVQLGIINGPPLCRRNRVSGYAFRMRLPLPLLVKGCPAFKASLTKYSYALPWNWFGAGFRGKVEQAAAHLAKFRSEVAALQGELLDRIHRRFHVVIGLLCNWVGGVLPLENELESGLRRPVDSDQVRGTRSQELRAWSQGDKGEGITYGAP